MHRQAHEVLPALLAALDIDTAHDKPWLFGHSDGGSITLLYAARFPQAIAGAIVLAPHILGELTGPPRVGALARQATPDQMQRFILPVARAEMAICFAITEPEAGSDAGSLQTRAVRHGDEWVLDGVKRFISGSPFCDMAIVIANSGDDPAAPAAMFLRDDDTSVSFGDAVAWTGLACAQVERDADADTTVRVVCLGGLREGAVTADAIVLNFPPGAAEPSLLPLPAFLPEPTADPRLFEDDAAIYAQSGPLWLRIDREDLTRQSLTGPSPRVRGGHSISLSTGATFLVGGWTGDDRPVDHWHVFMPSLAQSASP